MKRLEIKDWFLNKLANEKGRNIHGSADVVFGETEKAYNVMFDCVSTCFTAWVPKSVCTWVDTDENHPRETHEASSFEEAVKIKNNLRSLYC